jgi:hypothetical protein
MWVIDISLVWAGKSAGDVRTSRHCLNITVRRVNLASRAVADSSRFRQDREASAAHQGDILTLSAVKLMRA